MTKPLVTFVAVAHNEPEHRRPFILSMRAQTDYNYKAVVWHNGPYNQSDLHYWDLISAGNGQPSYRHSDTDTGNWGTANRQRAIEECDTPYIIQTSVQDYWLPQAVQYINQFLEDDPDILIWNSINHLVGPCQVLDSRLEWAKVDWGNFAIKTDIAKAVGINHGDKYTADWLFINDVLNSGLVDTTKIKKTSAIFTIHN